MAEPRKEKPKKNAVQEAPEKPQKTAVVDELTETLQRLQAEFENYKKRAEKESVQQREYAAKDIMAALLPVLDSFELAFQNTKDTEKFVAGMKLVYGQLYGILEQAGLRKIEAIGKHFDPYYHEVLLQEPTQADEGKVLEELQKGYMLKNMVIRHSKVKVATAATHHIQEQSEEEKL